MKNVWKIIVCMVLSTVLICGSVYAENSGPEHEKYTMEKLDPYLTKYYLTLPETVEAGIVGGEGYQVHYTKAISDIDANYMLHGTDTSGVHYSHDGGKRWYPADGMMDTTTAMSFYPGNRNLCYVLCASVSKHKSGLYESTDGGMNWKKISEFGVTKQRIGSMEFGKAGADGIYPMYIGVPNTTKGVLKSVDKGRTFTTVGLEEYFISDLETIPGTDTVIATSYTGTGGVFVSRDAGATWTKSEKGIEGLRFRSIAVDTKDSNHWIASPVGVNERKGPMLYETLDGGASWEEIAISSYGTGPGSGVTNSFILRMLFTYPDEDGNNALLVQLDGATNPERISFDNGRTIQIINRGDRKHDVEKVLTGWYSGACDVTPADPSLVVYAQNISRDGGKSFSWSISGISGYLACDFVFDKETGQIRNMGGYDVGILQAVEGYEGDFPPIIPAYFNKFPPFGGGNRTSSTIAVDPNDQNHIFTLTGAGPYGQKSTIVETKDNFKTFLLYSGMGKYLEDAKKYPLKVWYAKAGKSSNVVYSDFFVSEDNGKTWRESTIRMIGSSPFNEKVVYGKSGSTFYISYDCAKTWHNTGVSIESIQHCITVDLFDDYVIWAGKHGGSTLYRIDLKTGSIEQFGAANGIKNDLALGSDLQLRKISQCPFDKNIMALQCTDYYCGGNGFFMSFDGGKTWHGNLLDIDALGGVAGSPTFHPTKKTLWLGGHRGVYVFDWGKYLEMKENGELEEYLLEKENK